MKNSDEGSLTLGTKKFQQKTKRWKVTILQRKFIYDTTLYDMYLLVTTIYNFK